jgi:mannosyltransferase OCH1-like enzyme
MQSIPLDGPDPVGETLEQPGPPEVRMFWTGPPLSPYERLSLQSFVAAGAKVILYATSKTLQVPDGVERVDLHELLAGPVRRFLFSDGDPSPALHSDLVRYVALHRFGGWYADIDMICLGRLPADKVYIVRQRDTSVNGAILKLPPLSPVMAAAIERAQEILPAEKDTRLSDRNLIGPLLVTQLVNDYALDHLVRSPASAYAIKALETPALFDPRRCDELNERIAESDFVHLWNEYWRRVRIPKDLGPPKGSFLDGLFARFGISFDDEARLTADAVAAWFEENSFLVRLRHQLGTDFVPGETLARLAVNGHVTMDTAAAAAVRVLPAATTPPPDNSSKSEPASYAHSTNALDEAPAGPPEVRMFWTGPPLSPYELLSLQSFAAAGARVFVYSTTKTLRVPESIELLDARELWLGPVHRFFYPDGDPSPALHSNLMRYVALERFGGWYADLDMICLRGLPTSKAYLAWQNDQSVNGAILKFPLHSPVMAGAIEESRARLPQTARGAPMTARNILGPPLVTKLVQDYALDHLVRPISSAYPISYHDVPAMFDPRRRDELNERIADSDFVHLWNEFWRRMRIPKDLGPPKGSFLDGLFARFGISFDDDSRLSAKAVAAWFEENRFLVQLRHQLGAAFVPGDALVHLTVQMPAAAAISESPSAAHAPAYRASAPQTVRTFWGGGAMGPYQLLGLRSFADRGHRVEAFTFDRALTKPSWITWQDAADIIPAERVVHEIAEPGQSAIHANLFRHALLHRHGGWWIDPDVVLLGTELPDADTFFARSHDTQLVSPAAMKFSESHPTLAEALIHSAPFDETPEQWDRLGAALLTECLAADDLLERCQPPDVVSPISWFDVEVLFDPARADMLEDKLKDGLFLDLHQEAWLRAGVPRELGPPLGSYLDRLFKRHEIGWPFAARIEYGDLQRWFAHMYRTIRG